MSDPTVSGTAVTRLAAIRAYVDAATEGPWWFDESENCWRLHGVMGRIPAQLSGRIPEQIVNKQILKAPKRGTSYAEYWPDAADAEFIVKARTDLPVLLAVAEAALAGHEPQQVYEDAIDLWGRALCDHDPDDIDSDGRHDQSEDGYWVCLDKPLPSVCRGCPEVDGECPVWPCEPYKAIAGALGIETKETADDDA